MPRKMAEPKADEIKSYATGGGWQDDSVALDAVLGNTSGFGSKTTFAPKCVHDITHVIDLCDVAISVSDGWGARKAPRGSVVLNCTGGRNFADADLPASMRSLRAHLDTAGVDEISLDWPDGGIPPVLPSFWRALVEACAASKQPLIIHCVGGHGRTGTALAAILIAYSISAGDAVAWVRKYHCKKAIETLCQERYLDELDDLLNNDGGAK